MKITKATLAKEIARQYKFSDKDAKEFVQKFFVELKNGIIQDGEARIRNFGNFSVRQKKERPGRNPRTNVASVVSARKVVTFSAGKSLIGILNPEAD